jgi:hypothetical protein
MAVAIILAYAAWLLSDWKWSVWRVLGPAGILASTIILARYSLKRYFGTLTSPSAKGALDEQRVQEEAGGAEDHGPGSALGNRTRFARPPW